MSSPAAVNPSPRWPWICLALAMIWVALVRIPLVLNAEIHLDSDLAVDGLTLLDATKGIWRWHFPGTPHMGTAPILLSYPFAKIFGTNASTLVMGGVLAYEAAVLMTFLLCLRAFGHRVAAWSLIPLAFASVGTIWLSGRLTGGHLLTVAWFAGALTMLHAALDQRGALRSLCFGLWCGLGFWLDQMVLSALLPLIMAYLCFQDSESRLWRKLLAMLALVAGFAIGDLPREIGYRQDPYDSYREQFDTIVVRHTSGPQTGQIDRAKTTDLALGHMGLLSFECLPRLISGHLIKTPDFGTEPRPEMFSIRRRDPGVQGPSALGIATLLITSPLLVVSVLSLLVRGSRAEPFASRAVIFSLIMTTLLVTAGFVLNKNIFNSDNYRYLVFWLVTWAVGFGLLMEWLWRKGAGGKLVSLAIAALLPTILTLDTISWYRGFGWIDGVLPVRAPLKDPAFAWLKDHPEHAAIFGGYWDVYRLEFLLGGKVKGLPYPNYPDRFDAAGLFPGRRPRLLVARARELGGFYESKALEDGGQVLFRAPGLLIIDWPVAP